YLAVGRDIPLPRPVLPDPLILAQRISEVPRRGDLDLPRLPPQEQRSVREEGQPRLGDRLSPPRNVATEEDGVVIDLRHERLQAAIRDRLGELEVGDPDFPLRRLEVRARLDGSRGRREKEQNRGDRHLLHFFSPSFSSFNATEFMQYLWPVGWGPSS